MTTSVGIIVGSKSDLKIAEKAAERLGQLGIGYEITVCSAHRSPEKVREYAKGAESQGLKVIIAGAGLSAALPGVVASYTTLPVIGLPIAAGSLGGVDSLYSIVQMPRGVPVATVGINNPENAAILAAQILALSDKTVKENLVDFRTTIAQ
ncbi:MAG: 5-(carboxyamino)imidazole ribonucleotide mutase [Candidatus Latescibacteria bacterium]|nr:5-(carboxyamino)imidazole ribonucleotide mutase [Candidatus Latescibacterota bacterium]